MGKKKVMGMQQKARQALTKIEEHDKKKTVARNSSVPLHWRNFLSGATSKTAKRIRAQKRGGAMAWPGRQALHEAVTEVQKEVRDSGEETKGRLCLTGPG